MPRRRFTEEQIIGVVKDVEADAKVAEVCRQHGVSEATVYTWKAKYTGLTVSELRRLKPLEDENRRLKPLVAEQVLETQALMFLVAKNA